MKNFAGETALITGASSGIGEAFARELARRKANVVLVARSSEKLTQLAQELSQQHGIIATPIVADLGRVEGAETVFKAMQARNLSIGLLVNNAGFATYGRFQETDLAREQEEILVNVYAAATLARLFLPQLLSRPAGGIINVASTAAFQPLPYMAVYGASKAFLLSFSEALWAQLRDTKVSVVALCPGPVKTNFAAVVAAEEAVVGKPRSSESVVKVAFEALAARRSFVVPGTDQYLQAALARFMPRAVIARITANVLKPRSWVPRLGAPAPQAPRVPRALD